MSARKNVIPVRLSDEELAFLDQRAAAAELPRATYARMVLGGTALGVPVPGKVERSGDGRQRGGVAVVLRPGETKVIKPRGVQSSTVVMKPRRTGHDTRGDRCPSCSALTYSSARGKRKCQACGWEGPA